MNFYGEEVEAVIRRTGSSVLSKEPRGFLFTGSYGVGKTSALLLAWKCIAWHRAYAIAWYMLKDHNQKQTDMLVDALIDDRYIFRTLRVYFRTQSELIKDLRDAVDGVAYVYTSAPEQPHLGNVLLVDDLGRGYDDRSGWNVGLQYDLIDHRWRNKLPTFFTTNLTGKQMRGMSPEWGASVDRIADPTWIEPWAIGGSSKRR